MRTDTAVGTLSREVPLGLLGRAALADEGSDGLVEDRSLEKNCRGTPFGRAWQVLIQDEVTQRPGGEPREVRGEIDKGSGDPAYKTSTTVGRRTSSIPDSASLSDVRM